MAPQLRRISLGGANHNVCWPDKVLSDWMKRAALLFALTATLISCEESPTVECLTLPVAGLRVAVVDSITLSPPSEATLIARSAGFADSVGPFGASPGSA